MSRVEAVVLTLQSATLAFIALSLYEISRQITVLGRELRARDRGARRTRTRTVGICGHATVPLIPGGASEVCELPAGHPGWHHSGTGSDWTESAGEEAPR